MEAESLKSAYETMINERLIKNEELQIVEYKIKQLEAEKCYDNTDNLKIKELDSIWIGRESTETLEQ